MSKPLKKSTTTSNSFAMIILMAVMLTIQTKDCPPKFDPNCQYCDEQSKCMYCNSKYYLNSTITTGQFCYPCQSGCDKCFNHMYCTICQPEEYFLESSTCIKCMKGCKICSDQDVCIECFDDYLIYNQRCAFLKIHLYFAIGIFCLVVCLLLMVCLLCYKIDKRRRFDENPGKWRKKKAGYSFTVLDDETKRGDQSKISDVDTIGKVTAFSHLSFIENKQDTNLLEDGTNSKKMLGSFLKPKVED